MVRESVWCGEGGVCSEGRVCVRESVVRVGVRARGGVRERSVVRGGVCGNTRRMEDVQCREGVSERVWRSG